VEVRDAGGAVVGASPSKCEYGFQGRRLDPKTGLVFFRARHYSPETGRFVQRDPVWDAGNVGGQYTFCGNGPGSGRDPGGLQQYTSGKTEAARQRRDQILSDIAAENDRFFGPRQKRLDQLNNLLGLVNETIKLSAEMDQYRGERGLPGVDRVREPGEAANEPTAGEQINALARDMFVTGNDLDVSSPPTFDPAPRARKITEKSQEFLGKFAVSAAVVVATGPLLRTLNALRAGGGLGLVEVKAGEGVERGLIRYTARGQAEVFESTLKPGGVLFVDWVEGGMMNGLRDTLAQALHDGHTVKRIEGFLSDRLKKKGIDPCRLREGLRRELGGDWDVLVERRGSDDWVIITPL